TNHLNIMKIAQPSLIYFVFLLTLLNLGCKENKKENQSDMETVETEQGNDPVQKTLFGEMPDGRKVDKYTLRNTAGMEIDVITYGGIITRWTAPDKEGKYEDIVLGFNTLQHYLDGSPYFGALIGRY